MHADNTSARLPDPARSFPNCARHLPLRWIPDQPSHQSLNHVDNTSLLPLGSLPAIPGCSGWLRLLRIPARASPGEPERARDTALLAVYLSPPWLHSPTHLEPMRSPVNLGLSSPR